MAVNKQPIAKKCRSFDISPAVMGYGNKKSNRNPGGNRRRKVSEYGAQLQEKQKVKFCSACWSCAWTTWCSVSAWPRPAAWPARS